MKKEIKYTDEPIGEIQFINDFLPSPEQLVLKEETVKVTLALTKDSVEFFKKIAKEQESHYQTMIRSLLEQYTEIFDTSNTVSRSTRSGASRSRGSEISRSAISGRMEVLGKKGRKVIAKKSVQINPK